MGLDNGIRVKHVGINDYEKLDINNKDEVSCADEEDAIDICYFRKCWGLRNRIVGLLHTKDELTLIEAEDIPAIIRCVADFLDERTWEEEGESIWTFQEIKSSLVDAITKLSLLKVYLQTHPKAEAYFLDSY